MTPSHIHIIRKGLIVDPAIYPSTCLFIYPSMGPTIHVFNSHSLTVHCVPDTDRCGGYREESDKEGPRRKTETNSGEKHLTGNSHMVLQILPRYLGRALSLGGWSRVDSVST